MNIKIEDPIREAAPELKVVTIEADVVNTPTSQALVDRLAQSAEWVKSRFAIPDINKRPGIYATRAAYKALGKEPNRYRPSQEALCRRIVRGMDLYYISALVDLINVLSIESGYSIGGFDADNIDGDTLTLGVGREGEEYEGIGRGQLNIACMPVFRDNKGGVGTPTSDNERTKIDLSTRRLMMTINVYGEEMPIDSTVALAVALLETFAQATNIKVRVWNSKADPVDLSLNP